ncbi:MAG: hypothetical protein VX546_13880 [Myxococcota bacterium]|nr:hypothetical protein [Myxococcota bacterium]
MSIRAFLAVLLAGLMGAGPAFSQVFGPISPTRPICLDTAPDVDPRRSLFVTELDVVQSAISLEDVMTKLVADSGDPNLTPDLLWAQWWDTQNQGPGLGLGANCDDAVNAQGEATINRFPIQCPRNEGTEINVDPFTPDTGSFYEPIALVNRFDLAPTDGANCGEYRVIFARHSGATNPLHRNLVIFEAVLPNPSPGCGLAGCRGIAKFWTGLSRVDDPALRADALRRFYLEGFPSRGIPPVIHARHFGPGTGQVRTNQFMSGSELRRWQLREFKLAQLCDGATGSCAFQFVPVTVKTNPFGELFDDTTGSPRAAKFQRHYLTQVKNLSKADVNGFFAEVPDRFNAGQSNSQGDENDYTEHFVPGGRFEAALEQRLQLLGVRLTPEHLVRRSMALSCAGCHQLSNNLPESDLGGIKWPRSLGFVQVSEALTDTNDGSEHFRISPALEDVFSPHREAVFEKYLNKVSCSGCPVPVIAAMEPPVLPLLESIEIPEGAAVVEVSEEVRRLDTELKAGGAAETVGGPRPVH